MQRLAFEVPDTLEEVALVSERPVFETVLFSKSRYPSAVDFPQVANIAFSAELIEDRVNSELLRIADDKVMVVRVVEHEPERTRSLEEVRASIENALRAEKAQLAALQWAQDLQSKLFNGEDIQDMLDQKSLVWNEVESLSRSGSQVPAQLTESAFSLSGTSNNNTSVVSLNNGNVGVVKVNAINPVESITDEQISSAQQQFTMQSGQRTYQNFIEALKSQADIEIVN